MKGFYADMNVFFYTSNTFTKKKAKTSQNNASFTKNCQYCHEVDKNALKTVKNHKKQMILPQERKIWFLFYPKWLYLIPGLLYDQVK